MKKIIILTLVFMLCAGMYIPVIHIPAYTIVIGITLLLLMIAVPKRVLSVLNFFQYKFFKILLLYVLWVCITGILLVLFGKYNFYYYVYAVYMLFLYGNFSWYIFPYIICPKYISLKFIARFLTIATYIICIYGLIEYFLHIFHINILNPIQAILVNRRLTEVSSTVYTDMNRLYSVFEEPGYLGGFLCINLPFIYNLIFSKFKIIKNKYLNLLLKKSYFIVFVLTIVFIQSPVWLIVFFISTGIYFRKKLLLVVKKYFIYICIIFSLFIFGLHFNFDFSSTFLGRITKTVESFSSLEMLVEKETSLAIRVVNYKTRLEIFIKNPILGIGYRNSASSAYEIFWKYNFKGSELFKKNITATETNPFKIREINGAILWTALSDTGIIGCLLFYAFLILSIKKLNFIQKKLNYSIEKMFIIGLKNSYISLICLSFYDLRSNNVYFWFLFGLTLSIISYYNHIVSAEIKNAILLQKQPDK